MGVITRDLDTMTEAVLDRIVNSNVGLNDKGSSSVLRILVRSILAELDIQYYTMVMNYIAECIDDASGSDLDRVVTILGVPRHPATSAAGKVQFGRATPSVSDIPIPYGTVVSTKQDVSGNVVEFSVTDTDAVLTAGQTIVDVNVSAVVTGKIYITPGRVIVMNNPVQGIDTVTNAVAIDGGSDVEDDVSFRARAKLSLAGLGKGTSSAIESAILAIDGIVDAMVVDQARGVGTSDVIVIGSTIPLPQNLVDMVDSEVRSTKAAGIDIDIIYPTVTNLDISITTNVADNTAGTAIMSYLGTLGIGDTFIVNKMERYILNASGAPTDDVTTVLPASNQSATSTQIIRPGTITINGVVWNG